MKTFLKPLIYPFFLAIMLIVGMFVGYKAAKEENEYYGTKQIDSLKAIISDNQNIAKLDTIFLEGQNTIDTIKIYYKIKQNEAKNDTSAITIYNRFENLLSKNRNRADKRSK